MLLLRLFTLFLAILFVKQTLAQANRIGSDFHQFVITNEFESLLESQITWRGQADSFVTAGGAYIGQFLSLAGVDHEIIVLGMLADNHSLVDVNTGADEKRAAFL